MAHISTKIIIRIVALLTFLVMSLLLYGSQQSTLSQQSLQSVLPVNQQMLPNHNHSIRLLSYNVFLRPPPIKTNQDDYKEERFEELLKVIAGYDIVCLQEMFQTGTFRLERLIEFGIRNGFHYWKHADPPAFTPGPVVDSGLVVLSRYPIINSHFDSYKLGILSDSASDKGYIYCNIRIGDRTLHLFTTHLQASYMEPGKERERELSVRVRMQQMQALNARIKHHLASNSYKVTDLVLLAGDMNVNAKEAPFRLTNDSCLKGQGSKVPSPHRVPLLSHPNIEQPQVFDEYEALVNIFYRQGLQLFDHLLQKHKQHPVTFGDDEYVLTDHHESTSYQRLDYIFTVLPLGAQNQIRLKALPQNCNVEQFKQQGSKFGQLSDHYGVSLTLQ